MDASNGLLAMIEGTLAEYEQLKAVAHSRFAEIERSIANLRPPWSILKQVELNKRKQLMFGPELKKADETKSLPDWCAMAEENRCAFRDAVAIGDYRQAMFHEGCTHYAEYQIALLRREATEMSGAFRR
jgi:hypothetical protein